VADGGTGASTLTGYVKGNGTAALTASNTIPNTDITGLGTISTQNSNNVSITGGSITGITDLAVADGGTGVSTSTGTTNVVLSNSPTIVTPVIATINDANGNESLVLQALAAATDYIAIRNGKDTQDPPHIYSAGASTNVGMHLQPKGSGLVTISDGTVTDKQLRFSPAGSASSTSTILATSSTVSRTITLPDATGTLLYGGGPLGTPSSGTLSSCSGLPISTGVSGLGTGIATALAINTGSAGAPVLFNGALGTPTSGTVTNLTGTASININGTVGATTASTGAFTTLSASGLTKIGTQTATLPADTTLWIEGGKTQRFGSSNYDADFGSYFKPSLSGSTTGQLTIGTRTSAVDTDILLITSTGLAVTGQISASSADTSNAFTSTANANIINSNTAAFGRTMGVNFSVGSGSASEKIAGVFGVYTNYSSSVGGALAFVTNNGSSSYAERMRLDSAGNLGIGVTPQAWNSDCRVIDIGGSVSIGNTFGGPASLVYNAVQSTASSGAWKYRIAASVPAGLYSVDSTHKWFTAASGTAGNAITFTQAMTLDASGNLLVGTTTSNTGNINGSVFYGGADAGIIYLQRQTGTDQMRFYVGGNRIGQLNTGSSTLTLGTANYPLAFSTNDTERARIDTSGNFLVNSTTNDQWYTSTNAGFTLNSSNFLAIARSGGSVFIANRLTSDGDIVEFKRSGSGVGSISVTTTATAYNTSSDYRRKSNVKDLIGSGAFIDALKPRTFDWDTGDKGVGFIAHEFAEVCPSAVTGEKDAVDSDGKPIYQAMQASSAEVIANLVAELQSLRQRVAALESN
jgi:hypothetical protein